MPVTFLGLDIGLFLLDFIVFTALYAAIALSLNLEFGYTGIPNFGKALFVMAGASLSSAFVGAFSVWLLRLHGDFIRNNTTMYPQITAILQQSVGLSLGVLAISLIVAAAGGALLGYLASYPAIRLKTDYLAMFLFAVAMFGQVFVMNYAPFVGGQLGIGLPDLYAWAGNYEYLVSASMFVLLAVAVYIFSERIARSPLSRVLRAIRDNESASEALGKDVVAIRKRTFVISSAISGIAGALYAFYTLNVQALTFDRLPWTFWPFVMVILGGAANNTGVMVGVFVFWIIVKGIDLLKFSFQSYVPFSVTWIEYLLIGGMIILVLYMKPEGILKEKPTTTLGTARLSSIYATFRSRKESLESNAEKNK